MMELQQRVALAKNLLSSIIALAFPEEFSTKDNATSEVQQFLLQATQIREILDQNNVFGLVTEGKALEKFHVQLLAMVDQTVSSEARVTALEILCTAMEQSPLEQVEKRLSKLLERVVKIVRYHQSEKASVAAACTLLAHLCRHIDAYTPEVRKELFESFPKTFPALLSLLNTVSKGSMDESALALWRHAFALFNCVLRSSPNSLRPFASKIESVAASMFTHLELSQAVSYTESATCLALLSSASEQPSTAWKTVMDKTLDVCHQQMDLLSGKRREGLVGGVPGTKPWLRDDKELLVESLPVYQRAELVLFRLSMASHIVSECTKSQFISEREPESVLDAVLTLCRRAFVLRALEVGKQSAVSEDGLRLPASVVYGVLPRVHASFLHVLWLSVSRVGICGLRKASAIARCVALASENASVPPPSLFEAIQKIVETLGASSVMKMGISCADDVLERARAYVAQLEGSRKAVKEPVAVSNGGGSEQKGQKNGHGKGGRKRNRRLADVSQLSASANAMGGPFVSVHEQKTARANLDAALNCLSSLLFVYGGLLPATTRDAVAELALQVKKSAKTRGSEALSTLFLAETLCPTASGARGASLVAAMELWGRDKGFCMARVGLGAAESLVHARAPPLELNFATVDSREPVQEKKKEQKPEKEGAYIGGEMDWEVEEDEEVEEEEQSQVKKPKLTLKEEEPEAESDEPEQEVEVEVEAEVEAMEEVEDEKQEEEEEEHEKEEEDKEITEEKTEAEKEDTGNANEEDDDDDDFPDIVDEEPDV